jgi:hypothetical protein
MGLFYFLFDEPAVFLQWTPVTSATAYHIKRATSIAGPFTTIFSGAATVFYPRSFVNKNTPPTILWQLKPVAADVRRLKNGN